MATSIPVQKKAGETVKKGLGERIVKARRRRGWSQRELARRLKMSRERLGGWERGRRAPGLPEMALLSEALGVPFEELMGRGRAEESIGMPDLEALASQVLAMVQVLKPWIRLVQGTRERRAGKRS
jgi:transcriptional regulator with XRE-family HTH domain